MVVLPLTYLGNVQYFSKLCSGDYVIDAHEHFIKQSYRNRCRILSADGVTTLTVNTVKTPNDAKCSMRDTRIDYSKRWQHRHWVSLASAYRNSPYFDFYEADFALFYYRRYDFLLDYNSELTSLVLQKLGVAAPLKFSDRYINPGEEGITDMRHSMSEKPRLHREDPLFTPAPYYQVFSERQPFVPNLSVVDLLFCEGPGALGNIRQCTAGTIIA